MGVMTVYFLVITSAFFRGANFVLAGPIFAGLTPLWSAAIRFLLGAILMFIIAGVRREDMLGLVLYRIKLFDSCCKPSSAATRWKAA